MTGKDLVDAITGNPLLMGLKDCPAVPAQMSCAVYGKVQDDVGDDVIKNDSKMKYQIEQALLFRGDNSQTAVWHFLVTGSAIHHFVVIPWYKSSVGTVYTLFMAYENQYSVDAYVKHLSPAPGADKGYKEHWTANELSTILSDLLTNSKAWEEYFGHVGEAQADAIHYYKYKITALSTAVSNVNQFKKLCGKAT
ncbi:hypothetical protein [Pseudomonas piscis]|uniref:Uncharacterized protein n=1 Tax=Pseudomonas piscis TaxID=2614538 RepID=A0A7X1PM31_9PSED|nr:hypothetical protein [Pseudomonas piscis]MQA54222.1 hypothetical protein [Pseudomonas piscis]